MGATGWKYFVPYQADVSAALKRLRKEVFAQGSYVLGMGVSKSDFKAALKTLGGNLGSTLAKFAARAADPSVPISTRKKFATLVQQLKQLDDSSPSLPKPKTIEELLEREGESGTHSILDIVRVCHAPEFGAVSPLSSSRLVKVFGTEKPSRVQVNRKYEEGALDEDVRERWQGIYIIAYRKGIPDQIFFAGCSGD